MPTITAVKGNTGSEISAAKHQRQNTKILQYRMNKKGQKQAGINGAA
jgi:hypothetical protein